MSRRRMMVTVAVLIALIATTPAQAEKSFEYSGLYSAWAQSQKDFFFGKSDYNDNYAVQMLRLNLKFHANEYVGAATRFDMAQGFWGVDNADRTADRPGGRDGFSQLFDFKDTNFLLHVDQAYGFLNFPDQDLQVRVGRMHYQLGNKMILDNNLDGVQVDFSRTGTWRLQYSKVSEGLDSLTDNEIESEGEVVADGEDAHLFALSFHNRTEALQYSVFGSYYFDQSYDDGGSYLPNDLNYFRSRFAPNVTNLYVLGLTGDYAKDGLKIKGEASYLVGEDELDNPIIDPNRQFNDVNNGDISGWNVYVKADYDVNDMVAFGGVFGMGSGDDDVTSGEGNVNKIRTSGFFYLTEVWEDSIMPDEEGITPQGLGAPNTRGYRELENTTAFQVNATVKPIEKWKLFLSYTYLMATEEIPAWSVGEVDGVQQTVVDYGAAADDIGSEFDYNLSWAVRPSATVGIRGGFFMPGDGALNLINGNTQNDDMAYETKGYLAVRF